MQRRDPAVREVQRAQPAAERTLPDEVRRVLSAGDVRGEDQDYGGYGRASMSGRNYAQSGYERGEHQLHSQPGSVYGSGARNRGGTHRGGRDYDMDVGFDRAWTSIRDSNISTIIICAILFFFGLTPGASIVSGFAVTLALGLVLNLFTAVLVTRTFLYLIAGTLRESLAKRKWLLGV